MEISIYHWGIVLILALTLVVPFWKIFPRAGWPAPLALLMLIAPANIILLWWLAFKRWPGDA